MSLSILRRLHLACLVAVLPFALVGCGGDNPASPSAAGTGVVLHGVVLGAGASASSAAAPAQVFAQSTGSRITVTVQEHPSFSATVSANGTFEMEGLPAGTLTLVFSSNGVVIGTITITGVPEATEVKIVVQVGDSGTVILVKLEIDGQDAGPGDASKTCLIEGGRANSGIELEGTVSSGSALSFRMSVNGNRASGLVDVSASGAQFQCNGDKGTSSACQATVQPGAKIHVRGTLTTCSMTLAQVVATQVKVQKGAN